MNNQQIPTEINIGDILRLALPLSTTVSAGARHARRNVKWVVLLTSWDDLEDQVEQGDLLIIPPVLEQQTTTESLLDLLDKVVELEAVSYTHLTLPTRDLV